MNQAHIYHERMRALDRARRAYGAARRVEDDAMGAGRRVEARRLAGETAAALEELRAAHGQAVAAHRGYWLARREAMLAMASAAAVILRDFERVCRAAVAQVPEFLEGEGRVSLENGDRVPLAPPMGVDDAP